jgi:hypothetical protein
MPHTSTAGLAESRSPSRGPGLSAEHFQTGAPGSAGGLGGSDLAERLRGSAPGGRIGHRAQNWLSGSEASYLRGADSDSLPTQLE